MDNDREAQKTLNMLKRNIKKTSATVTGIQNYSPPSAQIYITPSGIHTQQKIYQLNQIQNYMYAARWAHHDYTHYTYQCLTFTHLITQAPSLSASRFPQRTKGHV